MKKMLVFTMVVSVCSIVQAVDSNVPGVSVSPLAYFSFENSDGRYGPGAGDNPAWLNQVNGEQPRIVDRGVALWPLVKQYGADGVKGTCFDGTSMSGTFTDILTYDTASGSANAGATGLSMSDLQSHTVTFWIKSRNALTPASTETIYILHGAVQLYWTSTGQIGQYYWPNLAWKASDAHSYDSYGQWLFVAVTINQNGSIWYRGDANTAPEVVWMEEVVTGTGPARTVFYLGSRSYVDAHYFNYDLDEVRIWGSKTDASGSLSLDDITDIWTHDYAPDAICGDSQHPRPVTDLTGDCKVDFKDFTLMASEWLTDNSPTI